MVASATTSAPVRCSVLALLWCVCASAQSSALTEAYFIGDWCQIVLNPEGEERHTWTFEPGGVFLRHMKHNKPTRTQWSFDGERLRVTMIGRWKVERVSDNEFRYRQFVDHRVTRGACK